MRCVLLMVSLLVTGAASAAELAVPPPPGLPPVELVQGWLTQDPAVQEAQAGVDAARHGAGMLRASPYEFALKLSSQRRDYELGPTSKEWSAQLERTVRLPGKASLDRRLGGAEIALAEARLGEAMHEAARDFVDLWMDWQGAVRARELHDEQAKFGEESLRVVQLRQRAGDASALEANAVEADAAVARGALSQSRTDERKALASLEARFPGAGSAALRLSEPGLVSDVESAWRARILETSDPLRIAQVEVEKAELHAERARADRLPDPTVGAYTASEAFSSEKVVGVSVSVPIPGRFRSDRLGQALKQVDMAKAALDRLRRQMEIEVNEAYSDALGSFERWQLAEQSAAKTRENANLTQRAYALGEADLQALLLARRQAVEASDSALDARVLALRAHYTLLVDAHLIWDLDHS